MVSIRGALNRIAALGQRPHPIPEQKYGAFHELYLRLKDSGLFDPAVYLSLQDDVRNAHEDPWWHFLRHGLAEGRHFTSPESVTQALAQAQCEFADARDEFVKIASLDQGKTDNIGGTLREKKVKIGVYCSSAGNFYMQEIADLLTIGLQQCGIDAVLRDERSSK